MAHHKIFPPISPTPLTMLEEIIRNEKNLFSAWLKENINEINFTQSDFPDCALTLLVNHAIGDDHYKHHVSFCQVIIIDYIDQLLKNGAQVTEMTMETAINSASSSLPDELDNKNTLLSKLFDHYAKRKQNEIDQLKEENSLLKAEMDSEKKSSQVTVHAI